MDLLLRVKLPIADEQFEQSYVERTVTLSIVRLKWSFETHALARVRPCDKRAREDFGSTEKLALRWRADGNGPTDTSITLMAAHPVYIDKSMEVGSGPGPLRGLENR